MPDEPGKYRFGLREMFVGIALFGLLLTLLLPWIQHAREMSRRAACESRLKVLALGILNYHDTYELLPANIGPSKRPTDDGKSWLVAILPYIEQTPLYTRLTRASGSTDITQLSLQDALASSGRFEPGPHLSDPTIPQTVVKPFLCPSDFASHRGLLAQRQGWQGAVPGLSSQTFLAVTNYKGCNGSNWGQELQNGQPVDMPGLTVPKRRAVVLRHDIYCFEGFDASFVGHDFGDGVFRRNAFGPQQQLSTYEITDGTYMTFAIGEVVPAWCDWSWWYAWSGSTATAALPVNHRLDLLDRGQPGFRDVFAESAGFHSRHQGGAQFALLDGSVRFVVNRVDFNVYRNYGTSNGEENANLGGGGEPTRKLPPNAHPCEPFVTTGGAKL